MLEYSKLTNCDSIIIVPSRVAEVFVKVELVEETVAVVVFLLIVVFVIFSIIEATSKSES